MIIRGTFEQQKTTAYDFVDNKGTQRVGVTNVAFVRDNSIGLDSENRVQKIKLAKDYLVTSKVDTLVEWSVALKNGNLILLNETVVK